MSSVELSVIIPILERGNELRSINDDYLSNIAACGLEYEVIYVIDQRDSDVEKLVEATLAADSRCKSIRLSRQYGDSTAIAVGLEASSGERILILPPYAQIEPSEIPRVVASLDDCDMVVVVRDRESDSLVNRMQSKVYNLLVSRVADLGISDITCEVRGLRRAVAKEIELYGDLHRFLPQLADRLGFRVGAVQVVQAEADRAPKLYRPGIYVRRVLDVLTALFLLRFTKKPLRFFGLIGITIIVAGMAILGYVIFERIFLDVGLADRPPLFLGALAIVLGLQIVAVGLVGEIIIFTHAKDITEYRVREIAEYRASSTTSKQDALG